MGYEHRYFDTQLAKLEACLRCGDNELARLYLAAFDRQLSGYVRDEEGTVFPVLEMTTSGPASPTAKMRREHESLRRLVRAIWEALEQADPGRGLHLVDDLHSVLTLHVAKEDWVLYPLLRRAV